MTDQELDQMLRRPPPRRRRLCPRSRRSCRPAMAGACGPCCGTPCPGPGAEGGPPCARSRRRPALRTAARHAAAVLLVLVLSAAVLVTVSPQARADITRWVAEQTGNVLDFQFRGDSPAQPIPQYQITALPEGYVETERTDAFGAGNVTYKNSDGDMILLSYTYMHDGAHDGFILDNTDTMSDIRVSGMPGKLILSSLEDHDSYVTWIDGASNMQFTVSAAIDEVSIIAIAESVSLCNSTK